MQLSVSPLSLSLYQLQRGLAQACGQHVRLVPLDVAAHAGPLHAVSCGAPFTLGARHVPAYDPDAAVFAYLWFGPCADASALAAALTTLTAAPDVAAATILDAATGTPVGMLALIEHRPAWLRVEIGHVWVAPVVQGTAVASEAVALLLRHCFERCAYRRVEWKCDTRNLRSRRAAVRLGFAPEGEQTCHMVVKGRNRDTAWFGMVRNAWPAARGRLLPQAHSPVQDA
jgi:RimJ/RimL family protein N-acetyltransferase